MRLRTTSSPGRSRRAASDSGSPGTPGAQVVSANASSTTSTRPGRARAARSAAGCSTEVGLVGLPIMTRSASAGMRSGSQPEPVRRVEQHPLDGVARGPQRRLRLGELRVHHHRPACPAQRLGDQHEALGGTGGQQHLGRWPAVPGGDGGPRRPGVRVRREVGERCRDRPGQPARLRGLPHVDGEVDQALAHLRVAVVGEIDQVLAPPARRRGDPARPARRRRLRSAERA